MFRGQPMTRLDTQLYSVINFVRTSLCAFVVLCSFFLRYDTLLDEPFESIQQCCWATPRKLDFPRLCFHVLLLATAGSFIGFVCRAYDEYTNVACTQAH